MDDIDVAEPPTPEVLDAPATDDGQGSLDGSVDYTMETDLQVQDATDALQQLDGISPATWQTLDAQGRLEALQSVEDSMAAVQGRPGLSVEAEALGPGVCGAYDGSRLVVNAEQLDSATPVGEFVDTVVHEDRHAFQDFAVSHPGTVTDGTVVGAWAANMEPGQYLSAEDYGLEAYAAQPIEADAWAYAGRIAQGLGLPRLESE